MRSFLAFDAKLQFIYCSKVNNCTKFDAGVNFMFKLKSALIGEPSVF